MTIVIKTSTGYSFENLSAVGKKLVNEFQRQHPHLCEPSSRPEFRFIHCGNLEENRWLEELIARVETEAGRPE